MKLSRSARRLVGRMLLATATTTATSGAFLWCTPRPAAADPAADTNALVSNINALRAWFHLPALQVDPALSSYSLSHSAQMAPTGTIFHTASLMTVGALVPGWSQVGENVAAGPNEPAVATAFAHSLPHLRNILGPYDVVGVGVVQAGGLEYVTEEFAQVPL